MQSLETAPVAPDTVPLAYAAGVITDFLELLDAAIFVEARLSALERSHWPLPGTTLYALRVLRSAIAKAEGFDSTDHKSMTVQA